jgi:hypothetical protein
VCGRRRANLYYGTLPAIEFDLSLFDKPDRLDTVAAKTPAAVISTLNQYGFRDLGIFCDSNHLEFIPDQISYLL